MPNVWRVSTSLAHDLMRRQTKADGGHEGGHYWKGNYRQGVTTCE
jgi:hypothetical protein